MESISQPLGTQLINPSIPKLNQSQGLNSSGVNTYSIPNTNKTANGYRKLSNFKEMAEKVQRVSSEQPIERTKVLILGAGMAGITAARTLYDAGITDFIVLEADNRIGGRLCEKDFCGLTVEAGANWIHGIENNNNPLLDMAKEANFSLYETKCLDFIARDAQGVDITGQVKSALHTVEKAEAHAYKMAHEYGLDAAIEDETVLFEDAENNEEDSRSSSGVSEQSDASTEPDISLKEVMHVAANWKSRTPAAIAAEFYHIDFTYAVPLDEVSLLGNLYNNQMTKFGYKDALVIDKRGYSELVRRMAQPFAPGTSGRPSICLNEYVTEIHYSLHNDRTLPNIAGRTGSMAVLPQGQGQGKAQDESKMIPRNGVFVRTRSGRQIWARYAIITFTNAVITSGDVKFVPRLPEWKLSALKCAPTLSFNKIFVKFPDNAPKFWDPMEWILYVDSEPIAQPEQSESEQALASEPSSHEVRGRSMEYRRASSVVPPHKSPSPSSMSTSDGRTKPVRKLSYDERLERARSQSPAVRSAQARGENYTHGFYTVWLNLNLAGLFPGSNTLVCYVVDEMARYVEQKTDAELKDEVTLVLRAIYGEKVPEPEALYCTRWNSNPLTRGAYHSIVKGLTPKQAEDLCTEINSLHFAGDGADVEFNGFLNGAYKTGLSQAKEIIEKLAKEK